MAPSAVSTSTAEEPIRVKPTVPDTQEAEKKNKTPLELICQGQTLPGIPTFPTFDEHRRWMLSHMVSAQNLSSALSRSNHGADTKANRHSPSACSQERVIPRAWLVIFLSGILSTRICMHRIRTLISRDPMANPSDIPASGQTL